MNKRILPVFVFCALCYSAQKTKTGKIRLFIIDNSLSYFAGMLIDRRVVFMFAAPDISILANWFYIYYLAKIQFFFRFIIYEDEN